MEITSARPASSSLYATHFLARTAGIIVQRGPCLCTLCGCSCCEADTVPVEMVIRDTFTNHGLCRAPASRLVCLACNYYFNHRWTPEGFKKPAEHRLLSMKVFADRMEVWQRDEMRGNLEQWLITGCSECLLIVSLAKKKHLLPLAVVNPPGDSFAVQVEEDRAYLTAKNWFPTARAFDGLLALGFGKGNILEGQYHPKPMQKANPAQALAFDRVIAPWRPSALLTLLSYVTIVETDDEPGGTSGD